MGESDECEISSGLGHSVPIPSELSTSMVSGRSGWDLRFRSICRGHPRGSVFTQQSETSGVRGRIQSELRICEVSPKFFVWKGLGRAKSHQVNFGKCGTGEHRKPPIVGQ